MSIRTRLTLWYSVVLTVIVVGISIFLVWRLRADLTRGLDASLVTRAHQTQAALEDPTDPKEKLDLEELSKTSIGPGAITQVVSPDGRLIRSAGDPTTRPLVGAGARVPLRSFVNLGTLRYRVLAVELSRSPNLLVIATSTASVEQAVGRLTLLLSISIPAGIALSVLGGNVLARRALRPIDRMTQAAAAIRAGDDTGSLDVPKLEDEVGRLGRTLNAMLDGLQSAIVEQRRFTSDASHELRTPLAIMQSEIDVALRSAGTPDEAKPVLESVREEVVRMTRIVENLLTLALADEGRLQLDRSDVDVAELATRVRSRFERAAETNGAHVVVDAPVAAVVRADRLRIEQLLSNLVDNAIKHSPKDGTVRIGVSAQDGTVRIDVADDGPGIPPADLGRVFERFHRVDAARTRADGGAGLGLAICRSIAIAHGGHIEAANRNGAGSVFTVRLPAPG